MSRYPRIDLDVVLVAITRVDDGVRNAYLDRIETQG